MRRAFEITGEVLSARAYFTGLGIYELYLNGEKANDEYLVPGCTAYDSWIQYQTYDVTDLIHTGENVIGAILRGRDMQLTEKQVFLCVHVAGFSREIRFVIADDAVKTKAAFRPAVAQNGADDVFAGVNEVGHVVGLVLCTQRNTCFSVSCMSRPRRARPSSSRTKAGSARQLHRGSS